MIAHYVDVMHSLESHIGIRFIRLTCTRFLQMQPITFFFHLIGIRLVNGSLPNEGRIEITINRMDWFTVCSNKTYWTPQKSEVVCRQLGYPGHVRTFFDASFGRGTEPVGMVVDHIDCTGG